MERTFDTHQKHQVSPILNLGSSLRNQLLQFDSVPSDRLSMPRFGGILAMLPFRTILHPTDFSDRSKYAFRIARGIARDYGAQLIVMHAWARPTLVYGEVAIVPQEEDYFRQAENNLRQYCANEPALNIQERLVEGEEVDAILHLADESQVDLIVLGAHRRTALGRLFMGSVAEKVVRGASCPVMTIRTPYLETVASVARAKTNNENRSTTAATV
jgi:nucleotide-binding universal stress UspA family protein